MGTLEKIKEELPKGVVSDFVAGLIRSPYEAVLALSDKIYFHPNKISTSDRLLDNIETRRELQGVYTGFFIMGATCISSLIYMGSKYLS